MLQGIARDPKKNTMTRMVERAKRIFPKLKENRASSGPSQLPNSDLDERMINTDRAGVPYPWNQRGQSTHPLHHVQSATTSLESRRQEQHNSEGFVAVKDKELPPIPVAVPTPEEPYPINAYSRSADSLGSLTREMSYQDQTEACKHSTIINIEKAGNLFMGTNYGTLIQNHGHESIWFDSLPQILKIALKADHQYYPGGEEAALRRTGCTPGTRIRIIQSIIRWATDLSWESQIVYWLSGQAGVGKTAIALTISHELEILVVRDDGSALLGGSFFCSRHSSETRSASAIIRTITYRLAVRSPAFRTALMECGRFETVEHGPKSQLEGLLIKPWKQSAVARRAGNEPCYVISIDALDELDGEGGTEFLGTLFEAINTHELSGLKFFITSRLDPTLVKRIESFEKKQICRLEQVPIEESNLDIQLFLTARLGHCATTEQIDRLVADAAGLFIYAATVVEYMKGRDHEEQKGLLQRLLTLSRSRRPVRGAMSRLDDLYAEILETSLVDPRDKAEGDVSSHCISILHTFLCTMEPTSPSVAISLLNAAKRNGECCLDVGDAKGVLYRLHAVLYLAEGSVMWFHKSFPDFVFDKQRSKRFYCNQEQHQRLLLEGSFAVMKQQLRFNIGDIHNSFHLDRGNTTLASSISANIQPVLRYACQFWSDHLMVVPFSPFSPVLGILNQFLGLQVLFWIEAMNLMKQRGRCESMLREAQRRVNQLKGPEWLVNDLAEAAAFALHFSGNGAASSTPHLYISSLATFPRDSNLCQTWRKHFSSIPKFINALGATSREHLSSFMVGSAVGALAISSDGASVACGSEDWLVRIWNMRTGEEVKIFAGHTAEVTSVVYSPDGLRLITGSADCSLRVWDIATGEELRALYGHTNGILAVTASPCGAYVASGSKDQLVKIWDLSSGEGLTLHRHTDVVSTVTYSPDGKYLAFGSFDGTVGVWNLRLWLEVNVSRGHTGKVTAVAFSPDGVRVASASYDRSLQVWNLITGEELQVPNAHSKWVTSVAYSSDGNRIVSGSYDESVRVWDQSTGEELVVLQGHSRGVTEVAYSPDGSHVISSSYDQSIRVWDVSSSQKQTRSKDGPKGETTSVAYSVDGAYILSGSADHSARLWDALTGKELKVIKGPTRRVTSVAYSSNNTCAISSSNDEFIRLWDLSTGSKLKVLRGHASDVTALAFSPDAAYLVSGSHDHSVRIWDTSTGDQATVFVGHRQWVTSVAFSPKATRVVSGSCDHSVRIWSLLHLGGHARHLTGHTDAVTSVAFSPDGDRIVSGSDDCSVRIWDALTGEQLRILIGHNEEVSSVAWSLDGSRVVSGAWDKSVRVWDATSGVLLAVLNGHTAEVTSVACSPDGIHIASTSRDKSVRVWAPFATQRYIREKTGQGDYTGWLVSPSDPSEYLMLVPLSENLPDDTNVLTIPSSLAPHIDFSTTHWGERWTESYIPADRM